MDRSLAAGLVVLLFPADSPAETPRLFPLQARLADSMGRQVSDGTAILPFQFFSNPAGGSPVWAVDVHRATVNASMVNITLGTKNPFPINRTNDNACKLNLWGVIHRVGCDSEQHVAELCAFASERHGPLVVKAVGPIGAVLTFDSCTNEFPQDRRLESIAPGLAARFHKPEPQRPSGSQPLATLDHQPRRGDRTTRHGREENRVRLGGSRARTVKSEDRPPTGRSVPGSIVNSKAALKLDGGEFQLNGASGGFGALEFKGASTLALGCSS